MPQKIVVTPVVHKDANHAVQATESGTAFVADAAGLVFALPAVEDGLTYSFVDPIADAAHPLTVRPQATDYLYIAAAGGAVGKGMVADSGRVGLVLTVLGVAGVGWFGAAPDHVPSSYEYGT